MSGKHPTVAMQAVEGSFESFQSWRVQVSKFAFPD